MGYYTNYSLSLISGSEEDYDALINDLKAESDIDFENYVGPYKWYDWEVDMKRLTKKYPNLLVQLEGDGEDRYDTWLCRFKNGDSEYVEMTFPPFTKLVI